MNAIFKLLPRITQFWIVWCPDGKTPPSVTYTDKNKAIKAADALANQFPDREFYVMKAKTCAMKDSDGRFSRRGIYDKRRGSRL